MMRKQHWSRCAQGAILSVLLVYLTFALKQAVLTTTNLQESSDDEYLQSSDDEQSKGSLSWTLFGGLRLPQSLASSQNQDKQDNSVLAYNVKDSKNRDKLAVSKQHKQYVSTTENVHSLLDDVFISVKTSEKFHKNRLDVIIRTWFILARDQTWFFTDSEDPLYQAKTGGHMINTNCSSSHHRKDLCCKMSVEFDAFMDSNKKWFCHFDDDNYVNIPRLIDLLEQYNPIHEWYLGRTSIKEPLKIVTRDGEHSDFWFATGGAGFCISRPLALKMVPIAGGGRFISVGERIGLPDDVTMGYIIEHMMKKKLTVINKFHSHLESMKLIKQEDLYDQVTFSYTPYSKQQNSNVVTVDGFNTRIDPTRFLSLHCHLFPNFNFCLK